MDGRAENSRRLKSIDRRKLYRAADLCELLSLPDEFLKSLTAMVADVPPNRACFIDGGGTLWCELGTVLLHLGRTRQRRGGQS
jgi:hypothetical protein